MERSRDSRDKDRRRDRDYDRDRRSDRDRSRDRDRDRDRHRDRSSSRDRRDRDRDRDRSRDRDRDDRYDERDRHSRRSQEFNDESDNDGDRSKSYGRGRWNDSIPNNIILVRGLPDEAVEGDVVTELMKTGTVVKDVRLMRSKDTGISLRYCFVEFHSVPEAQYYMEMKQGHLMFWDKYPVAMYYSTTRRGNINGPSGLPLPEISASVTSGIDPNAPDWICSKCSCKNFQRRVYCRRCSHSRIESDRSASSSDGLDQVGSNPCNTLILRGLDGLTTEDNIISAFANLTSTPLKNVRVIRDHLTGASSGYAFVELPSLRESQELLEHLQKQTIPLEVDGKALIVQYAKNTFTTAITTLEQSASLQQQQQQLGHDYSQQQGYYDYNSYYYQQQTLPAADSKNAAEVAQAAILLSQQKKQNKVVGGGVAATAAQPAVLSAAPVLRQQPAATGTTVQSAGVPMGANEYGQFPVPDVSTYQYDETSGYYYDPYTGLYYDANSTYYYNTHTQQYLYWDGEKSTYLPAPTGTQDGADSSQQPAQDDTKNKRAASPEKKVKIAKKIVKDMEKWAKKLNAQKEQLKSEPNPVVPAQPIIDPVYVPAAASATADAGFSLLEKTTYGRRSGELPRPKDLAAATATASMFSSKPESPPSASTSSEAEPSSSGAGAGGAMSVEELIDWDKLACLLCRRAFASKDILLKHQQMSDLHKKNVDELLKTKGGGLSQDGSTLQYRDRARERREKYGQPEPPQPKRRHPAEIAASEPVPFEQPTRDGIKDDNIGNRLLQKMGWNAGQGLGRSRQGIVDPIEARQRQSQAGLGARGSSYNVDQSSGTYKERARRTFYQYFQEIN